MAVVVAGNVGTALASLPGTLAPRAVVVCEASSFQLEDTAAFAPDAAVLLNLPRTTWTATARSRPTAPPSCSVFARQDDDAVAVAAAGLALEDARRRPGAASALRRRRRTPTSERGPGSCVGR